MKVVDWLNDKAVPTGHAARLTLQIGGIAVILIGGYLAGGGIWLTKLGGSSYYVLAGLAYISAGYLLFRFRPAGAWICAVVLLATLIWAVLDNGYAFWSLFPRVLAPAVISAAALLVATRMPQRRTLVPRLAVGCLSAALSLGLLAGAFMPHGVIVPPAGAPYESGVARNEPSDWTAYGRTNEGTRFGPFTQINRGNVKNLRLAWTYRNGDYGPGVNQNTPLQIGNLVYTCSPNDHVAAIDADTGEEGWTYWSGATSPVWQRCRGLGYHDTGEKDGPCARRIYNGTIDARIVALDAETGKVCEDFGNKGAVDLRVGQPPFEPGYLMLTSAPLVASGRIIVGGWVTDNQRLGEPSGVIRAFDAKSGELDWAWDLGDPSITKLPPERKTYTPATPNMWTTAAYDEKLGLVYLPLGNQTPDYYGVGRHPESDNYNSTLVALDVKTGKERWRFQTVHHDLWDYDLPAQPALVDVPDGNGTIVPGLMQLTKRGQIFLVNRVTGEPIAPVEERPVPQTGGLPEERLSPTQPYSSDMPVSDADRIEERKVWGGTIFDQLACRISFRRMRYDGEFTPPGLDRSIQNPGNGGGYNWGSASVDTTNLIAYLVDMRLPNVVQLVPTKDYPAVASKYPPVNDGHGPSPMKGTPYGVTIEPWLSVFGTPCTQPPLGTVTALDLKTRTIAWQVPAGTTYDMGPPGLPSRLAMPIGLPAYAGSTVTAGGLVFFAGFQDYYFRAYDAQIGRIVWEYRLPIGSSATPMTYVSPRTGKQYIVLSVGGSAHSKDTGDYVMAFALP